MHLNGWDAKKLHFAKEKELTFIFLVIIYREFITKESYKKIWKLYINCTSYKFKTMIIPFLQFIMDIAHVFVRAM